MSYAVHLFRIEVREKYASSQDDDFFEKEENLVPFTPSQKEALKNRLLQYNYSLEKEDGTALQFSFPDDEGIEVLLTDSGLYFSAGGEGIFEIGMTASEFTDSGDFAKYDPQQGGWEEMD